jgi:putative DNA primase/helicase
MAKPNTEWLRKQTQKVLNETSWYERWNWPVFPVSKSKAPLTPHGHFDASYDYNTILDWWTAFPTANVAIATGRRSQLVVIDIDNKNGVDGLASLREMFGSSFEVDADQQPIVETPNGGLHLYYLWDELVPATVAAGVLPGVDVRGEGGYVLAPPSTLVVNDDWRPYRWHQKMLPVPKLPDWAFHILELSLHTANKAAEAKAGKLDIEQVLTGVPKGKRDDQLFRYAWHLRGLEISYDIALAFICEAAARCNPPVPPIRRGRQGHARLPIHRSRQPVLRRTAMNQRNFETSSALSTPSTTDAEANTSPLSITEENTMTTIDQSLLATNPANDAVDATASAESMEATTNTEIEDTAGVELATASDDNSDEPKVPVTDPAKLIRTFQYTDLGNAKRWTSLFNERFRWIPELKEWYCWNGSRWQPDTSGRQICSVDGVLDSLDQEYRLLKAMLKENPSATEQIGNRIEANRKWYAASQAMTHIMAMTKLVRSQPGSSLSLTELDNKGHFLGVNNGILNLRTREFVQDQPHYYISKSCGADYDPNATAPQWNTFLSRIFENDADKIAFVQRLFGQALLGTDDKSILTIFCGHGANGKSTLVDTMITLLGDYAKNSSASTVMETRSNKEYYLAELKGVRLSIINESKQGAMLDEEFVKSLVDSGKIQARKIYSSPITFQPVTTPILTTNYAPRITGDYAIARRILFVPFSLQLPPEERNPKFRTEVLEKELSGILNWALDGCTAYLEQGLNPPECIVEATRAYVKDNDRFGRFLEDRCEESDRDRVSLQDIKAAYAEWLEEKGYREIGEDRVANDLRSRGYLVDKRNGGRFYVLGLKLHTGNRSVIDDIFNERGEPLVNPPQRKPGRLENIRNKYGDFS